MITVEITIKREDGTVISHDLLYPGTELIRDFGPASGPALNATQYLAGYSWKPTIGNRQFGH